ncbi:hypothetical protein [Pectinatus frisingensis]|uniref:hypothetical protein n=1 Tax=Pectinatus frisingensis TaxID=865 RepID=UPI0018C805CB|nr:hypothetical protein [Pectinatus frisingensis]
MITASPKVFITYVDNMITVSPKVFLTYAEAKTIIVDLIVDTERGISKNIAASTDTKRVVNSDTEHSVNLVVDTRRGILKNNIISAGTKRLLTKNALISADTMRKLMVSNININLSVDTHLAIVNSANLAVDSSRLLMILSNTIIDTTRRLVYIIPSQSGILHSLTLTLAEHTLSDTLDLEIVRECNISDVICGSILNYNYNFLVNETSQRDLIQSVRCMYDVDKLLYNQIVYYNAQYQTAAHQAVKIAGALGKTSNIKIDDFTPSNSGAQSGATYQSILTGLFGWTSRIPTRQINVFLRDNTLNFIQRGHETDSIDITDTKHSRPTIDRKMIRTAWSSNANGGNTVGVSGFTVAPVPFSGTIEFGDQAVSYNNGFIAAETHGQMSTTYSYDGDGFVASKHTAGTDKDGNTIDASTEYDYTSTARDKYLGMETETTNTTDKQGHTTTSVRITRHFPVGYGWYGTNVEQDGIQTGSSLSQGKSGGKASQFTIDQSNLSLGSSGYSGGGVATGMPPNTKFLYDTSFPVTGVDMLKNLTRDLLWLNRRIEETINMDIYDFDSVIDFDKQIIYAGNTYYLQSNIIKQTTRQLSQSITIVRWY